MCLRFLLTNIVFILISNPLLADAPYVDTMIIIAVDVSGSINSDEYELQKQGIVDALNDPNVQSLLNQCSNNGIGMTYLEWSGQNKLADMEMQQQTIAQVIPWVHLKTPRDLQSFSNLISMSPRSSDGQTDIAEALYFSKRLFVQAPFQSDRKIISLSTDGEQGVTVAGLSADEYLRSYRDQLSEIDVTVNAIAIDLESPSESALTFNPDLKKEKKLSYYLEKNVKLGVNSFVISAPDFKSYSEAFKKQIKVMLNACVS